MPTARLARELFRGVLFRSILVPLALMLLLAAAFAWQIGRLVDNAHWVEEVNRTIAQLNRMEKLHIDLETGLRGYLISNVPEFRQPYDAAQNELPRLYESMAARLAGRPESTRLLADIGALHASWTAYAQRQYAHRDAGDDSWRSVMISGEGKRMMDQIRAHFGTLIADAERLRGERSATVQRSARIVVLAACVLAMLVGLAIALLIRAQLRWLAQTYDAALARSQELTDTLEHRVAERTADVTRSNEQLAEANRELEAFSYSVSHDLRAPMRHITGFANLVRRSARPRLSADDAENLDTIHDTAVLAGRMVDDLLAFSRVGRTELRHRPVDMRALAREAIEALEPETAGRAIEWQVGDLPPASGDPALLRLVWQNLLGNAAKYTAKSAGATFSFRLPERPADADAVEAAA